MGFGHSRSTPTDTARVPAAGAEPMSDDWSEDWPDEETDNPLRADDRNFYKVEKWTKDGMKIDRMLYAGNNLDKARKLFAEAVKHRPRIRLTIRQRTRVLFQWPEE
jgi:hypothetical protein